MVLSLMDIQEIHENMSENCIQHEYSEKINKKHGQNFA